MPPALSKIDLAPWVRLRPRKTRHYICFDFLESASMFSYRHVYHAGNHADVLKHSTLLSILRHMALKDTGFTVIDTHAGAGVYRLDQEQARQSAEADDGILRLAEAAALSPTPVPSLMADYLAMVKGFNPAGTWRRYPGSPWIAAECLRPQDRLKLFEVHPTDTRVLEKQVAELGRGRQIEVTRRNGFEGVLALLPPPSRRALVLTDPSYELKTDYAAVTSMVAEGLRRFATGTYAVWYPVIARPEAHALPRKLRALAQAAGKPTLHATLAVGGAAAGPAPGGQRAPVGLRASGMFVINPPYTLRPALAEALPWLVQVLGQGRGQGHSLDHTG